MISVIYMLIGLLVWFLVNQLKLSQAQFSTNFFELRATRKPLAAEEKLATCLVLS